LGAALLMRYTDGGALAEAFAQPRADQFLSRRASMFGQ
jgi:hypothetical protein